LKNYPEIEMETNSNFSKIELFFMNEKMDPTRKLSEKFKNEKTKINIKFSPEFCDQFEHFDKIYQFVEKKKVEEISFLESNKKQKIGDHEQFQSSDVVNHENLEIIGKSRVILDKLKEEKLQLTILDIDQSKDRERALEHAMKDPEFALFVSEVLYIIGERNLENLENDMKFLKKFIK
jgi:hypothetical protein